MGRCVPGEPVTSRLGFRHGVLGPDAQQDSEVPLFLSWDESLSFVDLPLAGANTALVSLYLLTRARSPSLSPADS